MSLDNLLHALGGLLIAAACLYLPPAVLALLMPLLVGYVRETEQSRRSRMALEAMTAKRVRPGAFWHWSSHRVGEALSWLCGALLAVGGYAFSR